MKSAMTVLFPWNGQTAAWIVITEQRKRASLSDGSILILPSVLTTTNATRHESRKARLPCTQGQPNLISYAKRGCRYGNRQTERTRSFEARLDGPVCHSQSRDDRAKSLCRHYPADRPGKLQQTAN